MHQLRAQALEIQSAGAMDCARAPLHILLVDDDPRIRAGTAEMLGDAGHIVIEAESGTEALDILAVNRSIGLLITDNHMPGITGAELIARARHDAPALPILLITGYDSRGNGIAADIALLTKPFREARLLEAVQRLSQSTSAWSG